MPKTDGGDFDITNFIEDVYNGNCNGFMKRLTALLADSSYQIVGEAERATSDGRIDAVVKTPQYIYVFEFKLDKPAQEALDQINSKEYSLPFSADGRKLFKIGVSFSSETRKIAEWVAV